MFQTKTPLRASQTRAEFHGEKKFWTKKGPEIFRKVLELNRGYSACCSRFYASHESL